MQEIDIDISASEAPRRAPIRFTASGSEYFRIWIVNLLLTLVTLSLYYPFARARRLRYFHANTLVDGQPLGFHGDPWKMLRGHLLVLLFLACYGGAGRISPTAGAVAAVVFAALWPALWLASLRFALGNTSWRGLRMRFTGDLRGAYLAFAPLLPVVAFFAITALAGEAPKEAPPTGLLIAMGVAMLAMMGLTPLATAWLKSFQHGHYAIGSEQARFTGRTKSFYGIYLRTFGLTLLIGLFCTGLVMGLMLLVGVLSIKGNAGPKGSMMVLVPLVMSLVVYVVLIFVVAPFMTSRLQNLVWSHTESDHVGFDSHLRARSLGWRWFKNIVGMVFTLGLYRPFAVVKTTRLRLESTDVLVHGDPAQWLSGVAPGTIEGTGDAVGDVLGIDIGL
jgi:uncharacterized membrane protein YjgN (DUF898 family)